MIQIISAEAPFTTPRIAYQAATAIGWADAMGLIPADERIDTLDFRTFQKIIKHVHRAGIARAVNFSFNGNEAGPLEHALQQLNTALEDSPAPEYEWVRLTAILGVDLLSRLLGISTVSLRRYKASARATPDDVAARLHFLTLIAGDLGGAYNEIGIRQWFERKRAQLGSRSPAQILRGSWQVRADGPMQIRDLARSLTASPCT